MINVLVVDDSALVRKILSEIILNAPDINLVDTAFDPIFAIEKLRKSKIDVILLDIEMPRMDGLTFLGKLMKAKPIPVIIISSLTDKNASLSLRAMEMGAFDVLTKPEYILDLPQLEQTLLEAIRNAGKPAVKEKLILQFKKSEKLPVSHKNEYLFTKSKNNGKKIIVIGASTGGTTAIFEILAKLPCDIPGIVIVQHLPLRFSHAFAERLNKNVSLTVKIAETNEKIQNGFVYVAPGEQHCSITAHSDNYFIKLREGPKVHYHKPSVSVLFNSVSNYAGPKAIGVMLTGMGDDGSMSMKKMKDSGSYNIIQDKESSIVWGMPGKAFEYGAATVVAPLKEIAGEICRALNKDY